MRTEQVEPTEQENPETLPDEAGEQASPEEQAAYEEFVKEGYRLLYEGGEAKPGVLKMLDEDPSDLAEALGNVEDLREFNPVIALAATTAIITAEVCRQTKEKDGTIILHGGKAILEDLVELAGAAEIREYSEEEMAQAARMAADLFREIAEEDGLIDLDAAKGEWSEIVDADTRGELGSILPGIDQLGQQQEAPEPPPPVSQGMASVGGARG